MSQENNNQPIIEEGNNNRTAGDQLSWKDELRAFNKGKETVLWYSPPRNPEYAYKSLNGVHVEPEHAYIGGVAAPTWSEPVADIKKLNYNRQQLKSAKTNDIYKVLEDPFLGDFRNVAREYADVKMAGRNGNTDRRVKQASVGTEADFSAIDVVNVLAEMVGTELRTFVLEQALTVIGTPQLDLKVDTYTRFQAQTGVPEGVAPIPQRAAVSRTSYDLVKDAVMIGITDESQLRTVHDMYRQQVDTAVTDFKRLKSNKIATKLATASSDAAGGTWVAFTTDHNTTDPRQNIGTTSDTIFANNGAPNVICSHDKVWRGFSSSTYIKGVLQAIPLPDMSMAKIINQVPSMPGYTWYVDNEMTSTIASVFDRKAVAMLQGPVRTAQVRLELEGIDSYIYRDWNLPIFLVPSRVRQITGAA